MTKKIIAVGSSAALVMFAMTPAAFAYGWWGGYGDGSTSVTNNNSASVGNNVTTSASTGGNSANGGYAGGAGDGGSVYWSDDNNMGGAGGNGGNGGAGGEIWTGDATAVSTVSNDVNYNKTKIDSCGCEDSDNDGKIKIQNWNTGYVENSVTTKAKTGWNDANGGSTGGSAGNGGNVKGSDDHNTGGAGGNAGNGGKGGAIGTGYATAVGTVLNMVNTNITRVRH